MNDKDFRMWIFALATAFDKPINDVLVKEYLEVLRDFKLTAEQWGRVKYLAKRRLEFFPRIAQILDIAEEVRHEDIARSQADDLKTRLEKAKAEAVPMPNELQSKSHL